jgi:hypothetical protein
MSWRGLILLDQDRWCAGDLDQFFSGHDHLWMTEQGPDYPSDLEALMQDRGCSAGLEGTPVHTVVPGRSDADGHLARSDDPSSLTDQIVREGAQRMLAEAPQAEVDVYIA